MAPSSSTAVQQDKQKEQPIFSTGYYSELLKKATERVLGDEGFTFPSKSCFNALNCAIELEAVIFANGLCHDLLRYFQARCTVKPKNVTGQDLDQMSHACSTPPPKKKKQNKWTMFLHLLHTVVSPIFYR